MIVRLSISFRLPDSNNHLIKTTKDKILQVLKLSKPSMMGIATKSGMERTKNITLSSVLANIKYPVRKTAKTVATSRGIIPKTNKTKKMTWPIYNLFRKLIFNDFK